MTDNDIQKLIDMPKQIYKRDPKKGYKTEGRHKKCDLNLISGEIMPKMFKNLSFQGTDNPKNRNLPIGFKFDMFIRQHQEHIENFSIGLQYKTSGFPNGLNLIRYNGPHDSKDEVTHHLKPHIHKMTEKDIKSSSLNPKPTKIEVTKKYNTLEEGLISFFKDMNIINWQEHFFELVQLKFF